LPTGPTGYAYIGNGASAATFQGFLQSGTGATTRTWQSKAADIFSVKDFGAVGNGITDDTAAIQAAINAAAVFNASRIDDKLKGAMIFFPRGEYLITSTLTLNTMNHSGIGLVGAGVGATILKLNITSGDAIIIGNSIGTHSEQIKNNLIADMTVYSVPVMSANSAVLRLINTIFATIDNFNVSENPSFPNPIISDPPNNTTYNTAFTRVRNCIVLESTSDNLLNFQTYMNRLNLNNGENGVVIGTPSGYLVQDVYISNSIIAQQISNGILIANGNGIYLADGSTLYCRTGIVTYPAAGKFVGAVFATNWVADTSVTDGWKIITDGGTTSGVKLVNCWSSNNGKWSDGSLSTNYAPSEGRGLWVIPGSGTVSNVILSVFECVINRREGILVQGGSNLFFTNLCLNTNGVQEITPGVFANLDGFSISNATRWGISESVSYNDTARFGGITPQRYGIVVASTCNFYNLIGNQTYANSTGGISDAGGPNKYVAGNL
jgi:hypothetical protein